MKLDIAIAQLTTLFLDTAPVIYYVERHPQYFATVQPIFRALSAGQFKAITSPLTLAECLVIPVRDNLPQLQRDFSDILIRGQHTTFIPIDAVVSQKAASWRYLLFTRRQLWNSSSRSKRCGNVFISTHDAISYS